MSEAWPPRDAEGFFRLQNKYGGDCEIGLAVSRSTLTVGRHRRRLGVSPGAGAGAPKNKQDPLTEDQIRQLYQGRRYNRSA
tara:strand:- start:917 stop:1159 length:243 start_codon:yes stop_codon:yes gene_type:complete